MADKGGGRARGRARSRGHADVDPVRRPGQRPGVGPMQPQLPTQPVAPVGRVARGTPRTIDQQQAQARHGGSASTLAADMSEITLSSGDNGARGGGRGAWRGRDAPDPVTRPPHIKDKRGTVGKPSMIVANYFKVESTPNWAIYQHHVEFTPDVEGIGMRRSMLSVHKEQFGVHLFDGASLYTICRLNQEELDYTVERRTDNQMINIHIKLIKELPPTDPVVIHIMNIQIRKNMRTLDLKQLNRHYYDQKAASEIPQHNLELWPGFITAIHQHEESVLLCADLTFKILRRDTVLDQLETIYNRDAQRYKDSAAKELIGCIVLTRYNNATYRIDDIEWSKGPRDTFDMENGEKKSFIEYFRERWDLVVSDQRQPLLVSRPRQRDLKRGIKTNVLLVPEFCVMTGISEGTRSNFMVMKDIGNHTRVNPDKRIDGLRRFMRRMQSNNNIAKEMSGWGLSFANDLVTLQGRVLLPEKILMGQGPPLNFDGESADWSREMRSHALLKGMTIDQWVVIHSPREAEQTRDLVDALNRVCPPMGIYLKRPRTITLNGDRATDYTKALHTWISNGVQLVMTIVPNNKKDRYDAIKKVCCVDRPVASQVVVSRTISKRQMLMSVATKIGIQINCKLGGEAWAVDLPLKNVMVIGYDSYHDSSQRGRSVGAVCCSFNASITQYYSKVTFQTTHQEMVDGLTTNVTAAIKHYFKVNGVLPERIIIYRDGVGQGQLPAVMAFELEQILNCFKGIGSDFQPRLTFIVVSKRINTRLFEKQGSQFRNPTPGTVVDTVVTRPEFYDFFLVSQSVRQGTVSPTQYNIIYDTSGLRPDHLQRLTYKLTHLYFNWPGTIRVPAPCLYAHKLAMLTGQSLHTTPDTRLADTLFFFNLRKCVRLHLRTSPDSLGPPESISRSFRDFLSE